MKIKSAYQAGVRDAFARFKMSNLTAGAAAYNPATGGGANAAQASAVAAPMTVPKPSASATAPMASGAPKANVLG